MPQMDLEAARSALHANTPTLLLGLRERQWLDVKSELYNPRNPKAVEELAKDVAAFANGGGGLLVLGISTRLVHGEEVLDQIASIDRSAVDLDQLRKLIREHVTPAPLEVTVDWSDDGQNRVVFIDVPAPRPDSVFVVAAPVGKPGHAKSHTVAMPVRQADGTHWLLRAEIQRLLAAGVAALGMPGVESALRSDPAYIVRTIERCFQKWDDPGSGRHRLMNGCSREELNLAARVSWEDENMRLFLLGSAIQQRYMLWHWLDACRTIPKLPEFLGRVMSTILNGRRPPLRASWCAAQLSEAQREAVIAGASDWERVLEDELLAAIREGSVRKAETGIERILRAQFSDGEVAFEMRELTASDSDDFPLF
ncbi:helix-turn-helix domain-containing protein [Streptomyces sp. NPDC088253]|uniref:AlbA family DNA-binding domain-containing protein n=1 Tax=Streptomyces sp. NPDC088253 TaxID=3365846 RepID=UPI0038214111